MLCFLIISHVVICLSGPCNFGGRPGRRRSRVIWSVPCSSAGSVIWAGAAAVPLAGPPGSGAILTCSPSLARRGALERIAGRSLLASRPPAAFPDSTRAAAPRLLPVITLAPGARPRRRGASAASSPEMCPAWARGTAAPPLPAATVPCGQSHAPHSLTGTRRRLATLQRRLDRFPRPFKVRVDRGGKRPHRGMLGRAVGMDGAPSPALHPL